MILNLNQLNKRQEKILNFIEQTKTVFVAQIIDAIKNEYKNISKVTINRDLKKLIELDYIVSVGKGRALKYQLSLNYNTIRPIKVEEYFKINVDQRMGHEKFNFDIFLLLKNIFTKEENEYLNNLNSIYQKKLNNISPLVLKKEYERLTIELSWKSSQIEGNTYTLLETEVLIKDKKEARGHKKEESIMILNHKEALDYIFVKKNNFKKITLAKIENIHHLLTNGLNISKNLRKIPVGIVGTKYRPLDIQYQIREALEKTCILINKEKNIFVKTLIASLLIAYIQPFEDDNKRTSRVLGNAILLANNACPLSYRSVDEVEYKKAVILFYEQNNLNYFKKLFIDQFAFAVKNYF